MTINVNEFKINFDKYLNLVEKEDIIVTMNNEIVGVFSSPNSDPVEKLCGLLEGYEYVSEEKMNIQRIKEKIN